MINQTTFPIRAFLALNLFISLLMIQSCVGGRSSLSNSEKKMVEDYVFMDWDGNEVAVADFRGSVVVIDFWESWCGPCLSAFPGFQKTLDEVDGDLVIIAATTGWTEGREEAMKFKESNEYDFYFVDGKALSASLGFNSIPFKIIFDREGEYMSSHTGSAGAESEYEFLMELVSK